MKCELPRVIRNRIMFAKDQVAIYMCDTHAERFLYGLGLDEGYTPLTFPAQAFRESDFRESVFGDDDNYASFAYLLRNSISRMTGLEQKFKLAISEQDFRRACTISISYDWGEDWFYELGDFEHSGVRCYFKPEHFKFFTDFAWRFVTAFGDIDHLTNENTQVYVRILMTHNKYGDVNTRNYELHVDKFYIFVDTSLDNLNATCATLSRSERISAEYLETVCDFAMKLTDFKEADFNSALEKLLEKRSGGVTELNTAYNTLGKCYGYFIDPKYPSIGLRNWMYGDNLFDYAL